MMLAFAHVFSSPLQGRKADGIADKLRQGPYKLFFYSNEGNPREPVHVHVRAGSKEAKVWLEPDIALADNNGFHAKELKSIIGIVTTARPQIQDAWNAYFGN